MEPQDLNQTEPLITFPDPETPPPMTTSAMTQVTASQIHSFSPRNNFTYSNKTMNPTKLHGFTNYPVNSDTMKFEKKKLTACKKKVIKKLFNA